MKADARLNGVVLAALGLMIVASAVLYPRLPDPMPIHWNAAGVPDDFASRPLAAFLLPAVAVATYLLFLALPRIDPRGANYRRFAEAYGFLRAALTLFFVLLQGLILHAVIWGDGRLSTNLVLIGVAVLFIVIGYYMPRFRSNWFVGIRTPWTLSDERVWQRTHWLGGRVFMLMGAIMLIGLLLPAGWFVYLVMVTAIVGGLVPVVYSYLLFRQIEREGGQGAP